jgi:hypothetical protein
MMDLNEPLNKLLFGVGRRGTAIQKQSSLALGVSLKEGGKA